MQVLAGTAKIGFLAEVSSVNDECIAIPMRDRIAPVLMYRFRQMRTSSDGDDAIKAGTLADVVIDVHRIGTLDDAHHAAEISVGPSVRSQQAGGKNHGKTIQQATLDAATVFWTVGAIHAVEVVLGRRIISAGRDWTRPTAGSALQKGLEVFSRFGDAFLRFWSVGRDSAVGRIDDHRCAHADFGGFIAEPVFVVSAGHVFLGAADILAVTLAAVAARKGVALEQSLFGFFVFFLRHELPVPKLLWTLERDDERVAPGALYVRSTPGSFERRGSRRMSRRGLRVSFDFGKTDGQSKRCR